jgi:signal transduction histidine kinase
MSITTSSSSKQTTQSTHNSRWHYLTLGALGLTTLLIIIYAVLAITWQAQPFLGLFTNSHLVVTDTHSINSHAWNGHQAGIQPDDIIVGIDDISLQSDDDSIHTAQQNLNHILSTQYTIGDTVMLTVIRVNATAPECLEITDGSSRCIYPVTLQQFPPSDFLALFVVPFLTSLVILSIGVAIIYYRNSHPITTLVTLAFMSATLHTVGMFDFNTTGMLVPLWLIATLWIGPLLMSFGLQFPNKLPIAYTRKFILYLPAIVTVIITAASILAYYTPSLTNLSVASIRVYGITSFVILGVIVIGIQRPRSITLVRRNQSNALTVGVLFSFVPVSLTILSYSVSLLTTQTVTYINIELTTPFYMVSSLTIAYSILQFRQINTDRILNQTITYGVMLSILIGGYFLLVTGLALATQGTIHADNPIIISLVMFAMVMLFMPFRNMLQRQIDHLYNRTNHTYQQRAEEFNQKLTSLATFADIIAEFESILEETIKPNSVFVFLPSAQTADYEAQQSRKYTTDIRFSPNSAIIKHLKETLTLVIFNDDQPLAKTLRADQPRLMILKPAILAGLSNRGNFNGFVSVGLPRSNKGTYSHKEAHFLSLLIAQLAIAIERTQVINTLQNELKTLDVLGQIGQAINFTSQFDDLLELIYAQTSRLISVPNFYIALRDTRADRMYYAFFLENHERITDKENIRWTSQDDLIHHVFRKSSALNIADYGHEMAQRYAPIVMENPNLKAWMAVPLTAGTHQLGVLAVGKDSTSEPYTHEQFNILGDIGALAASSLDRLYLFNETTTRARQLQALNDISRQLSASGLDLDSLLQVITSSAVEILNADGGSLLLVPDNDPNALEYTVVVGNYDEALVGTRLQKAKGVIGQVAETGVPFSANITQNQIISSDAHIARTSLAVPLIANESVIGVLEVMNKANQTQFADNDIDLLSTFAGQAGIAIENARLFAMTDKQLAQRVTELEILANIDNQLNRTQQLSEIAQITVRAAMDNTEAQAGALGIVADNPPHLQIVARIGYDEADDPTDANNLQWSLDNGIFQRVMRTQQADIIYNTQTDPDYETGLRGSISQITIPMMSADSINAILILEKNISPPFSRGQLDFVQRLAEHASIAIANAQLYAELTRANTSKSEFMGFVAHELKNPLTSIKGYAELMTQAVAPNVNEQQRNFWQVVNSNANRMQTIIDDLRDFAHFEAGQLKVNLAPIELYPVLIESIQSIQKQFEDKSQQIHLDIPDNMPRVMADAVRITQVIVNILSNASKYSDVDSHIYVSARVQENFHNKQNQHIGSVVQVSFRDEGFGMSADDVARLFNEKYFRSDNPTTNSQTGTGLGMMITYAILQLHSGDIWVDSQLGAGSTFHITLPIASPTNE